VDTVVLSGLTGFLFGFALGIRNDIRNLNHALKEIAHNMGKNTDALNAMTQAVTDASAAIKDLAAKSANGEDVSAPLTDLAAKLEAAVTDSGEPTGTTA
jgi:methyl-accepting chemotaxis protein